MFLVAWTRTFAVVLPGVIETFDLPAGEAGLFVFMVEMGSFLSLLLLGFVIDQVGAFWGLRVGLVMLMVALLATAQVRQFSLLPLALLLLGSGIAWTATSINTLMAAMGERRSYYLGLMHSFYGFAAVLAPMVAGVVMAWDTWQSYYRLLSALSLGMFILVWKFEVGRESTGKGASEDDVFADADVKGAGWTRGLSTLKPIAGICLGVFALAGVQNVLNTWIYLYTSHTYNANHGQATLSPTVYWIGILLGRVGLIFLSEKYSARCLLIALSLLPAGALWIDHSGGTYWLALPAFFLGGLGVSGTFQLGTTWASERMPQRVGLASTAVMAVSGLGLGFGPWLAGIAIEETSFVALKWVVSLGCMIAGMAFLVTPVSTVQERSR